MTMLDGPPLVWAGQTALKFLGRTVVDEDYNGLALDEAEGDRIAASMGEADVVFMRNHGVMVTRAEHRRGLGRSVLPGAGPARFNGWRFRPGGRCGRCRRRLRRRRRGRCGLATGRARCCIWKA